MGGLWAWVALAGGPGGAWAEAGPLRATPKAVVEHEARVIVKFRANAGVLRVQNALATASQARTAGGPQVASVLGQRLGLTLSNGRAISSRMQVVRGGSLSSSELAQRLAAESDVEWAVPDRRRFALGSTSAPADPLWADGQTATTPAAGQWYMRNANSTYVAAINAPTAWAVTEGSSAVVVAMLDTGVRFSHPDLKAQLLKGYDFISDTLVANDGSRRDADASDPGDWLTQGLINNGMFDSSCEVSNSSWHGTQTSSLVGAAHDGVGMVGVAPGVKLLPVRVLGRCGGYDSDIIAGMRWAAGLSVSGAPTNTTPARVLNMSLGDADTCSSAYSDAIAELTALKVTVVAAAGNDSTGVGVPANCAGVVAVAGLRHSGTKVGYSNLGPEVTLAAPGGNCGSSTGTACLYPIITATNSGTTVPKLSSYTNGTNYAVGTSFSTPMVAGTVALMLSANSTLTPAQLTTLLQSSARPFPTTGADDASTAACQAYDGTANRDTECYCTTTTCGAGMLDAGAAVRAAAAVANGVVAAFTASADQPQSGSTVSLDASASSGASGASIASYQWAFSEGATLASFVGGTTGATAQVSLTGSGDVSVTLTVTDANGLSNSTTHRLTHNASATATTKSSGGGAWGWAWGLALWALAWALPGRRRMA